MKSRFSIDYTLGTHSTCISFGLSHFHASIKQISFHLHPPLKRYHRRDGRFKIYKMTVQELPSNFSLKEDIFTAYIQNLYPTKSQEGIQIWLDTLRVTSHQQWTIIMTAHT